MYCNFNLLLHILSFSPHLSPSKFLALMMKRLSLLLLLFLVHCSTHQNVCDGRATKHRGRNPQQLKINLTQTQNSEEEFMKWVNFVGSLKHSLFKTAKNKLSPSRTLTVSKKHGSGHFSSIQAAIDSLPTINLVRVVIKVKVGVYK